LGGGRRAQVVAACCAAASGLVMVLGHMVNTATFDLLAWLLIGWLVLRLLRTGDGRWYLAIGAVVGIGLLNKRLVALLVLALLLALLAVGPRRVLRTWWLPAGAAVAVAIAMPNLWWEAAHGWPQFTVAAGISERHGGENRALFVPLQVVQLSPLFVPIWVAGLVWLWRDPAVRWARSFAVAYPVLFVVVLLLGGPSYYVLPLLVLVMAAGAVPTERWSRTGRRGRVLAVAIVAAAAVNVVIALPVLPPRALGPVNAMNEAQGEQIGWPGMVSTVAEAWWQIPAGERARAVILAHNYGEAAAIARYGPEHGLPAPYSGHMSYGDWGPPPDAADGPVLLVLPGFVQWALRDFADCRQVATVDNGYGLDNELGTNVVRLCSGDHPPWSELWPSLRHY
jgi:4-amino-4-deoxy-L-arabinose transferase-like glycosyltransferase